MIEVISIRKSRKKGFSSMRLSMSRKDEVVLALAGLRLFAAELGLRVRVLSMAEARRLGLGSRKAVRVELGREGMRQLVEKAVNDALRRRLGELERMEAKECAGCARKIKVRVGDRCARCAEKMSM